MNDHFRLAKSLHCLAVALSLVAVSNAQTIESPAKSPSKSLELYDGFENAPLSSIWETRRLVPSAIEFENSVVLKGKGALKVTVHNFDKKAVHPDGNYTERDELLEAEQYNARENESSEHSFNMFIPADFPIVPTRLVIAQWKQFCPEENKCAKAHPVLAIRYVGGVLRITQTFGQTTKVLFEQKGEFRNRWLNFRFQVRFSSKDNGRIKAWMDGKQVVDYTGATANPENAETEFPNQGRFYFKMGLYRDGMAEPMTIYIDEYRKKSLREGDL
jgi:hypothetical protein